MSYPAGNLNAYTRVDVETASQGKLIIMLFNGAIKRAEEARRQLENGNRENVHANLIKSQDIIAELRGALNMKAGDIAQNLDRIYEYIQHLLITANMKKVPEPIEQSVNLMTEMRDTWQELFENLGKEGNMENVPKPGRLNQHGASMLNIQR